jgi:phosphoglycerate dehydrogenase-like enzyme
VNVMIATPIEPELVERIRRVRLGYEVLWEPDLLPEPRYPSDHAGWPLALSGAPQARWDALLAEADVMFGIPGDSPAQLADTVGKVPRLRWIQCTAAGAGGQVRAANLSPEDLKRIVFTTSAGVHGTTLAEFFFMGLLVLRKDLGRLERVRARRSWEHWAMGELKGSTLAIVGMGAIGLAIARVARAFGMRVLGVTRDGRTFEEVDASYPTSRLPEVAAQSDAVVVTLPGTPLTEKLFDRAAIGAMKRGAVFGSVGRGTVVDQDALIEALSSGAIAGAVLDVFTPEPLPPDNPLWAMENVVFSPHTAALSVHENARIVELFCENLERFADGRPLRNVVSTTEFY